MLSLSGPLTQHPERTLLPTHGHYPPTNPGRSLETFHNLFTLTHTPGVRVRLLTPLVLGSPLTAAHPDWSHISPSPSGSDGASGGGFYYTGHLWQPWFPLSKTRLTPATRPPASPWAAAGGSVSVERFRGRLYSDGVRSGAESDGARPHGELSSAHRRKRRMRRGGCLTEYYQTQHCAQAHDNISLSEALFFPSFFRNHVSKENEREKIWTHGK